VQFNEVGVCNACEWSEKKKIIDWDEKWHTLLKLCDKFAGDGKNWDVIVPFSGGKDSYHIAKNMKDLGMKPLLVKLAPLIPSQIGRLNDENIRDQGFDLIVIRPDRQYVDLCRKGMIEQGGEEGETEYGGKVEGYELGYSREWIINTYFSGHDPVKYGVNSPWWNFPEIGDLTLTHWSDFEDWNGWDHLETADTMGFLVEPDETDGVTNKSSLFFFGQLDDPWMYALHTHFMFLKFGFGRAAHEASMAIRAGEMDREEGIRLAQKMDDFNCKIYMKKYSRLFQIEPLAIEQAMDIHANKALMEWNNVLNKWMLRKELTDYALNHEFGIEVEYDGTY
jgi:hypothetical protein